MKANQTVNWSVACPACGRYAVAAIDPAAKVGQAVAKPWCPVHGTLVVTVELESQGVTA